VPKRILGQAIANYVHRINDGAVVRLRAGPVVTYDTDVDDDATWFYGAYAGHVSIDAGPTRIDGGITGRYTFTSTDDSFSERSWHQAGIGVSYAIGNMRPGVYVRMPVGDDLGMRSVVGLSLSYIIP
jgi:hypothetical protein